MNKKILIADDEPDFLEAFKACLEKNHYDVITANDGIECLQMVKKENPDLVITDIIMPDKDGAQVIFELQKESPGIKIIAVSGGGEDNANPYLEAITACSNVKHTFQKPFDMDEVLATIKEILGNE